MKKKFIIINLFMSVMVLFSILFQSVHSFEHFEKQSSEKCPNFKSVANQNVINHSHHHDFEKCPICDFTFSAFTSVDFYSYSFQNPHLLTNTPTFYTEQPALFYKGSLFALRAPPTV